MATFRKRSNGWYAEVRRKGVYRAKTFRTKAYAEVWAREIEREIDTGELVERNRGVFEDAIDKYLAEVVPGRKGARWEKVRLNRLKSDPLADVRFQDLSDDHLKEFRDRRLKEVAPSTVNRELNLISGVISTARDEWKWIEINPMSKVKRPKNPKHRERRPSQDEIDRICDALGFDGESMARTTQQKTALAYRLAIETAMRQGEIAALRTDDLRLDEKYLIIRDSKNNDSRHVPLSPEAIRLIGLIEPNGSRSLLGVRAATMSTVFRVARMACGIDGLTFHDSRHEAMTRLARKLQLLDLMRMVGVRDARTLSIYYNPTATEIAERLA